MTKIHTSRETGRRPVTGPVTCIGETMAALIPEPAAPLDGAGLLGIRIAGAESNVAMYLADHGVPARWVSALGDDPFGHRIRAEVAASGVDVSGVRTDPHRPTGLLVKDPGTEGTRVHYYRRGSAASALTPDLLDDDAVRSAGLIHLSGITPALSAGCRDLVTALLEPDVAERPCPVSFDVNHRAALWADGAAATVLLGLARRADITFVGLDEAQALWGDGLTDAFAVRDLLPQPPVLVVKDGARAATAFDGSRVHIVPAPKVEVIEPVGAGDAFAAGFLAGLLRGEEPVRALRLGHLTAGAALRVTGDHGPLPDRARLAELLDAAPEEWAEGG
ncbi:sugar kinase [Streptomyces laculatispora]|uniref:Sugar kinase n=1 Tax=Streptomyces laculatispora TaxID=887464 RepID=A0ABY9HVU6_9ACTN|nr:sugar kinase [Streptomyces laculatispora]WLQ38688.1 sugar kinase [Streptomyces laculatispora]